jgi:hypothetical protein
MVKQSNGMVLTSQGWMSKGEYKQNGFLKLIVPDEMKIGGEQKLEDTEVKKIGNAKKLLKETK